MPFNSRECGTDERSDMHVKSSKYLGGLCLIMHTLAQQNKKEQAKICLIKNGFYRHTAI